MVLLCIEEGFLTTVQGYRQVSVTITSSLHAHGATLRNQVATSLRGDSLDIVHVHSCRLLRNGATSYLSRELSSNQTVSADNLQPDNKTRLNNFNLCWTNVCLITARDKDDSCSLGLLVFTRNFSYLDMYFSRSGSKELTTMQVFFFFLSLNYSLEACVEREF